MAKAMSNHDVPGKYLKLAELACRVENGAAACTGIRNARREYAKRMAAPTAAVVKVDAVVEELAGTEHAVGRPPAWSSRTRLPRRRTRCTKLIAART